MPLAIERLLQCRQTLRCNRSHTLFLLAPLLHTGHPHSQRPTFSDTFTERERARARESESESERERARARAKASRRHRNTEVPPWPGV
jgi:hypothetical protein